VSAMAPTPKPAALKLLTGRSDGKDSGGRPVNVGPAFRRVAPAKPDGLSAAASEHWDEIVPELTRLDLLSPVHVGALVMLCEAFARWTTARDIRAVEGVLGENSQGRVRHPAAAEESSALKDYHRLALEFGLTPSAEQRVGRDAGDGGDGNPFAGPGA
jgi:P27 family predicted phage terminase small subunit